VGHLVPHHRAEPGSALVCSVADGSQLFLVHAGAFLAILGRAALFVILAGHGLGETAPSPLLGEVRATVVGCTWIAVITERAIVDETVTVIVQAVAVVDLSRLRQVAAIEAVSPTCCGVVPEGSAQALDVHLGNHLPPGVTISVEIVLDTAFKTFFLPAVLDALAALCELGFADAVAAASAAVFRTDETVLVRFQVAKPISAPQDRDTLAQLTHVVIGTFHGIACPAMPPVADIVHCARVTIVARVGIRRENASGRRVAEVGGTGIPVVADNGGSGGADSSLAVVIDVANIAVVAGPGHG
jgi:hypothetical protein